MGTQGDSNLDYLVDLDLVVMADTLKTQLYLKTGRVDFHLIQAKDARTFDFSLIQSD